MGAIASSAVTGKSSSAPGPATGEGDSAALTSKAQSKDMSPAQRRRDDAEELCAVTGCGDVELAYRILEENNDDHDAAFKALSKPAAHVKKKP